jgi:hypothetical protein
VDLLPGTCGTTSTSVTFLSSSLTAKRQLENRLFAGSVWLDYQGRLFYSIEFFFQFCEAPEQFKFQGEYFLPEAL